MVSFYMFRILRVILLVLTFLVLLYDIPLLILRWVSFMPFSLNISYFKKSSCSSQNFQLFSRSSNYFLLSQSPYGSQILPGRTLIVCTSVQAARMDEKFKSTTVDPERRSLGFSNIHIHFYAWTNRKDNGT
jgi:hypothetical protein